MKTVSFDEHIKFKGKFPCINMSQATWEGLLRLSDVTTNAFVVYLTIFPWPCPIPLLVPYRSEGAAKVEGYSVA